MRIAQNVDLVGIKKMEIVTKDGNYCAVLTAEFINKGEEWVELENANVEVRVDLKAHEKKVKVSEHWVEIIRDGKKEMVQQIIYTNAPTVPKLLGTAEIGTGKDAFVFKGAKEAGVPCVFEKEITLQIGREDLPATRQLIADIMNLMGNPREPFVMQVRVRGKALVGNETRRGGSQIVDVKDELSTKGDADGYLAKKQ
jgi:hypothetical protein